VHTDRPFPMSLEHDQLVEPWRHVITSLTFLAFVAALLHSALSVERPRKQRLYVWLSESVCAFTDNGLSFSSIQRNDFPSKVSTFVFPSIHILSYHTLGS